MDTSPIVTLTLNPALDVSSSVPVVTPSDKLRCGRPRYEPGGGGINVSRVSQRLGEPTLAVLPVGGATGQRVAELLGTEAIAARTVPIEHETRQSISIFEEATGHQYRFVLPGPSLAPEEAQACRAAVREASAGAGCLVVSGSLPDGVGDGIVADLVTALPDTRILVDTSGPALAAAFQSGAHLVKPSARELAQVVGRSLTTEADITAAAVELYEQSRIDVLVASIGAGGAIAIDANGPIRVRAPTVKVRSAVGAGDSMVAGLAVGIQRDLPLPDAVSLGVAAGTATVLSEGTNLCQAEDVAALLDSVAIG